MTLEKQKKFYDENGYLVLEDAVDGRKCDYFLELFKNYSIKKGNSTWTELIQIHTEIPEVLDLMREKKIVDSVENLLEGEAIGLQSVCSFKKFDTLSGSYAWNPHQDNSYIKSDEKSYVSGDIVLENHEKDSGVLYVYPGSHREKLLPFEPHKSFDLPEGENPGNKIINVPSNYEKVDLYLKKGSCLMFHPLVIHGSYKNISKDKWRPILLMNYVRKNSNYYKGGRVKRTPVELRV